VAFRPAARQQATKNQPFLSNGSSNKHILRQRKNISIIEETFSMLPVPRFYKQGKLARQRKHNRVEAGLNKSTVNLRVVGGDEKENLKSVTVKYGYSDPRKTALARASSIYKSRPVLSSEREPQGNKTLTVKQ
jgi:hypothetical protein